ncbi:Aste57867_3423 [Aphanomyces stellatus]|uniref:Aste57867_3423 protein n=1 Tax=Aphanomyces stellatus TaxID=120398 RepID=A0A485K9M4_9STRA|nr:hypothetical protein As57867_003413 [Aphanomyces stellatus]VFT80589.1 Aste57867_3423 [Aphanomyces stellatus]
MTPEDITGVAIAAVVVVAVAVVWIVWRRSQPPTTINSLAHVGPWVVDDDETNPESKSGQYSKGSVATTKASSDSSESIAFLGDDQDDMLQLWRLHERDVVPRVLVARGAFGEVWRGEYRGTSVAMKKLLPTRASVTPAAMATFVSEILLMAKLESPFIVHFVGVSWYRKTEMTLVVEFMDSGDLRSLLDATTPATLILDTKLSIALSVIHALVYLHTLDMPIIHRDIKSRNVLLDSLKGTKVTDFGISRETSTDTMTMGIGTCRWMAPEILIDSHYSPAADVYSFGILLAELDMHILPYSDQVNASGVMLTGAAIMGRVLQGNIQPTFSTRFPPALLALAQSCLAFNPDDRPDATQVAFQLRQLTKRADMTDK